MTDEFTAQRIIRNNKVTAKDMFSAKQSSKHYYRIRLSLYYHTLLWLQRLHNEPVFFTMSEVQEILGIDIATVRRNLTALSPSISRENIPYVPNEDGGDAYLDGFKRLPGGVKAHFLVDTLDTLSEILEEMPISYVYVIFNAKGDYMGVTSIPFVADTIVADNDGYYYTKEEDLSI